jgi:cytochrome c peroxidase
MLGPEPDEEEVEALLAYFASLAAPPNPFRDSNGTMTDQARRGEQVFRSERAGCATCHNGPYFTDGQVHDVGTGRASDRYPGYNTPSLIGVYQKILLMHDGRCRSLEELLTGPHRPDEVTGLGELTASELQDLIAYLRSL